MSVKKLLLMISLVISPGVCHAAEPAGARVQSMGGAGVAVPAEAATIYWNPAGLFHRDRMALDLTVQMDDLDWPGNWGVSYLNYSRSLRRGAGLGIYRMLATPADSGDAIATLVTTVYRTPIGIPLGLSFKYVNENWAEQGRKSYFTGDVGVLLPVGPWLVGANFQSVTQPDSRIFPYRVLVGVGWDYAEKITLTTQAAVYSWQEVEDFDPPDLRAGLGVNLSQAFSLQGGWAQIENEKYWTGGFGLSSNDGRARLYVSYHWHPSGEIDDRYFISYNQYLQ